MQKKVKIIFHIDMNAFYASCAMIKEPYLKHKVFVVGGQLSSNRGVISTASYKARKLGIKAAMGLAEALKIYPRLLVVPTDFNLYREKSELFMNLLSEYSNLMLPASIDEAYLDVTELVETRHPLEIAKEIQTRLYKDHQLPCSIGIAPTLFLAKMASDLKKPLGITVLRKRDVKKILYPLDVADIHGIGKQTYPKLHKLGIQTIGDFMNPDNYSKILTVMKPETYQVHRSDVLGESSNIIEPEKYSIPKSISSENTFNYDVLESSVILNEIFNQLKECVRRLNKHEMYAKTVSIKLKKAKDFSLITRSLTLDDYTDDFILFKDKIETLFETHFDGDPVRLAGAGLSNLLLKKDRKIPYNLFTYQKFM
ncbi:DNA polymerase IV [Acholeplasma equirhinis]|uniref:DNA polymerase IV n=1 Tax=Acholeplasma equirhinis TaxID=555393 RepID=UPI00197A8F06|nr:DNA polymerase IV [Acholeplasma equirhinis]MBN3490214.1 DNA polymerase IV [Acholeplasma equirhinis]